MEWKIIKIKNEFFAINYMNECHEKFVVILSDFKVLWRETLSWTEIFQRAKVSFPVLCRQNILMSQLYWDFKGDSY